MDSSDMRPVIDSEYGPIHRFKDCKRTLSESFDDEYFHNIQWAHFTGGGAGGWMRWPNRHPHVLTHGMRRSQRALANVVGLIDWTCFRRRNLNTELAVSDERIACFGCGDGAQALIWLLRTDTRLRSGQMVMPAPAFRVDLNVPGLEDGGYRVARIDTSSGKVVATAETSAAHRMLVISDVPITADLALVVRRIDAVG